MKKPEKEKNANGSSVDKIDRLFKYLTEDMWRITEGDLKGVRLLLIKMLKTLYISIRRFIEFGISSKASALTYSTLLSIIPMLALLFAIAKGFGFQNIIQSQLFDYFPAHREALTHAQTYIDAALAEAQGGVFVGVGLVLLFMTVIFLIDNIERVFNGIFQVKKGRSINRKITDYTAFILIVPILMILSSGISIFLTTSIENNVTAQFFSPLVRQVINYAPFFLTSLFFTTIYLLIPNTRVRFLNALVAGIVCGVAFQLFQNLYISGQIWVTRYNAIYGSFAFLPLFLLWMQLSWMICLFGAVLTFSSQNIENFNFEHDTKNISRRYNDFTLLLVASIVVKRFVQEEPPLTVGQLSNQYQIPIQLTSNVVFTLTEIGILNETLMEDRREIGYQPAIDINRITVKEVLQRIERHGSEKFLRGDEELHNPAWVSLIEAHEVMYERTSTLLLKDM